MPMPPPRPTKDKNKKIKNNPRKFLIIPKKKIL
jgi:hypothetical protein